MNLSQNFEAHMVRRWAAAGVHILREHRAELNALNVYPVPDGDTGTNLYLTFAAAAEAELQRTGESFDVVDALEAMARGALLGARGNSGVILAQSLAGFATAAKASINNSRPLTLANLLTAGAHAARQAIEIPQEGTALTVLDAAAHDNPIEPGEAAQAAREALRRTPDMLDALKLAGVVDAGGRGVVLLLDALNSVWHRTDLHSPAEGFVPLTVPQLQPCNADAAFELMFVTEADVAQQVSATISEHGVSVAITSGVELCQIHIHCDDPEDVIRLAEQFAPVRNIRIEKLTNNITVNRRLVASAFGSGIVQMLAEANVVVVAAEPDSRPSVQDFVAAALKANATQIILLPSDKDSLKVAQLAAVEIESENIECHVIPTISIQQTLAAVAVSDSHAELRDELEVLTSATRAVTSIGFTRASRSSNTPQGAIAEGDVLSFLNGHLHSTAQTFAEGLSQLLENIDSAELVTVIIGRDLTENDQTQLTQLLITYFPDAEIVTILGRQDVWSVLVGVE